MKLLFLSKQHPQQRDLLSRPYGRFYYLPKLLAQSGHDIFVALANYRNAPPVTCQPIIKDNINWYSYPIFTPGHHHYIAQVKTLTRKLRPDYIIGLSDIYFGLLATYLANKHNTRSVIDAYDNYESYIPIAKPLHLLWQYAIRKADIVTAAGPSLANKMQHFRMKNGRPVDIIPMAADPIFHTCHDDRNIRDKFGLPKNCKLIGYTGSIDKSRGIKTLFEAYESIAKPGDSILLVMSGKLDRKIILPERSLHLGYIGDELIPALIQSMDVVTSINTPSMFGNFSYPSKIYEAIACNKPVVSTMTASTSWILRQEPQLLCEANSPSSLAETIIRAFSYGGTYNYENQTSWESSTTAFNQILNEYSPTA